jgi:hypothetical protein
MPEYSAFSYFQHRAQQAKRTNINKEGKQQERVNYKGSNVGEDIACRRHLREAFGVKVTSNDIAKARHCHQNKAWNEVDYEDKERTSCVGNTTNAILGRLVADKCYEQTAPANADRVMKHDQTRWNSAKALSKQRRQQRDAKG